MNPGFLLRSKAGGELRARLMAMSVLAGLLALAGTAFPESIPAQPAPPAAERLEGLEKRVATLETTVIRLSQEIQRLQEGTPVGPTRLIRL